MGNANSAVVWGVVLIVLAAAGLVAGAIVFFTRFNRETRRLTEKMCHAGEDGEYRYLAGKLRRHYLLLIPFVPVPQKFLLFPVPDFPEYILWQ